MEAGEPTSDSFNLTLEELYWAIRAEPNCEVAHPGKRRTDAKRHRENLQHLIRGIKKDVAGG